MREPPNSSLANRANAYYWGLSVGFYGGINYGFGYFGNGYEGGRWDHGHFFYNTSYNNLDTHSIHNVYNTRVNEGARNHVSFNGGNGGINAHATAQEEASAHETHARPVAAQTQHAYAARNDPQQKLSTNHGTPAVAATPRPNLAVHPKELPPVERTAVSKTGNAKADQKYQKQQDKLVAKQTQDRQKLQQKQDKEHQQLAKHPANEAKTQQMEQQTPATDAAFATNTHVIVSMGSMVQPSLEHMLSIFRLSDRTKP